MSEYYKDVAVSIALQDMRMFHQDRSRLNRENVVLTKEINDLRRKAKALSLQQNGVERVRDLSRVLLLCRINMPRVSLILHYTRNRVQKNMETD